MIAMMTAATQANKNAFITTASLFSVVTFVFILSLFLIGLTEQLVSAIAKHSSPVTDSITSMFSLTEYNGWAYGPDCSWATSSNPYQDKMDSYPSCATVVGIPTCRAINGSKQVVLAGPRRVKERRA
jgi:hypothetical protein